MRFFTPTLLLCASCAYSLAADTLKWPPIFGDNAVLQANAPIAVFGSAPPQTTLTVSFLAANGSTRASANTRSGPDGQWLVRLNPIAPGQRGSLRVKTASGESLSSKNILTGEVWLCSGQSNMQFTLGDLKSPQAQALYRKEAARADGDIRCFAVPCATAETPSPLTEGKWEIITPDNARWYTAVGWNFAVALREKIKSPVGLISSSWGDSAIESWLAKDDFKPEAFAQAEFQRHADDYAKAKLLEPDYAAKLEAFNRAYPTEAARAAHAAEKPYPPYSLLPKRHPGMLYNAMIHGLTPYTLRGILWYQGENNAYRPDDYAALVRNLIQGWRARFQNENAPFYYVELAGYGAPQTQPSEDGLALIREVQSGALTLPHTGVATAVDVGEADNIHPQDKRTVGRRLAAMALNDVYQVPSLCRSPQYAGHEIQGDTIRLRLQFADGLRSRTPRIEGFAVADAEGHWFWADEVKISSGNTVLIRSTRVKTPVALRYAWASTPKLSLENAAGLPLRPFRTDVPAKTSP